MDCPVEYKLLDLGLLCRICLGSIEDATKISLFSSSDIDLLTYKALLVKSVPYEVSWSDGLPAHMCSSCATELNITYKFITKFKESNERLNEIVRNMGLLNSNPTQWEDSIIIDDKLELIYPKIEPKSETILESDGNDDEDECQVKLEDDSDSELLIFAKRRTSFQKSERKRRKQDSNERKANLQCDFCNKVFNRRCLVVTHMRTHTDERPFQCTKCLKRFIAKRSLDLHIKKNHSEKREHTCEICGKQFFDRNSVVQHIKIHNEIEVFPCKHCAKTFKCKANLRMHVKCHGTDRPFCCNICGKTFVVKQYLDQHLNVHSDQKKFSCEMCGKKYKTWNGLKLHRLVHRNEKPFSCLLCNMSFFSKTNLNQHTRIHHSEKSGHCDICKKSFSNLKEHSRLHTREATYQCDLCKQKFIRKNGLTLHMLQKHDGATKYKCLQENCPLKFPSKTMLDYHVLKFHTKETPHVCTDCNMGFYRICDLTRHIKAQHNKADATEAFEEKV